jgi:putative ABC transport system permease protein
MFLINFVQQAWAVLWVAAKRLSTQFGFSLATIVGLIASASLILSIPLYADATQFRLLRAQIIDEKGPASYAPLKFLFEYEGKRKDGPQWQDVQAVDEYLSTPATGTAASADSSASPSAASTLGLRRTLLVRRFSTDTFQLFPQPDPNNPASKYFLTWSKFAFLSTPEKTIQLVDGEFPQETARSEPVEVLVNQSVVEEFGLQIGEIYYPRRNNIEIPIIITGIWTATDPNAIYWDPQAKQMLLVSEQTYANRISPTVEDELLDSYWYIVMDGSSLHTGDVPGLLERIQTVRQQADQRLTGTSLVDSPLEALENYQKDAPILTLLLYAFSIPILGLILAFIGLVAGLFISQQRNEIAVLRSRGATITQITLISTLQGSLLALLALAAAIPLAVFLAHAIGRARSFLNFTAPANLRVELTPQVLGFGIAATVFVLLIQIIVPTLTAARQTVVTYKQERARAIQAPWWQRAWLDVLLLALAGYGIYLLQRQGGLIPSKATQDALSGAVAPDPLQNPMLLLVPALGIFAVTLIILRLVPTFMSALAWLVERTKSVGLLMAARYLSRTPAAYNAPLILLVLTLSLSAFTASLAQTLDRQLIKQVYYQVGADINLTEEGTTVNMNAERPVYTFAPLEDHLRIPEVMAATPIGRYPATTLRVSGGAIEGIFIGLDRLTFLQVAFWQRNFAPQSLGTLLNTLAETPNGVWVSRGFMNDEALKLGDTINLSVRTGQSTALNLEIVGVFDLFPTWYPEDGPLFVGNLDYFFSEAGGQYPHQVWLRTSPKANASPEEIEHIVAAVRGFSILLDINADQSKLVEDGLNTLVTEWSAAPLLITAEQRRPERQGLFGLLSVGFATSALLTVMGFVLYTLFSFRRRFIELGMLRAIGLSASQMTTLLASELIFLVGIGIGAGTLLGIIVSRWFIPFLQVGASTAAHYPPFVVEIAWGSIFQIYILFALLFLFGLVSLTTLLLRMKIFQAIKLGETT